MTLPKNRAIAWGLLAAWAGAIWYVSSVSQPPIPDLGIIGYDKLGHLAVYAVLGFLSVHALSTMEHDRAVLPARAGELWQGALLLTALWGWIDEIHQFWVPGRRTEPLDFVADLLGGCLGALLALGPLRKAAAKHQDGQAR